MTKSQILNKYGKEMSASDRKELETKWSSIYDTAMYYVRLGENKGMPVTDGLMAGTEVTPGYPDYRDGILHELVPVYEVEWLETDDNFVM